ncbi:hypothetical protein [Verrucomicrobium sp. BvORR034]|uniref:hypothetical protein n=1 Tax=Verrucomicrobium sp. BvORR034 TaxID=1396418 RepID=UPI000678D62D|nr:hypothetical protein [Verrucomicrobium sp. BvORR034]
MNTLLDFIIHFALPLLGFLASGYVLAWLRADRERIEREEIQDAAIREAYNRGITKGRQDWQEFVQIGKN